MRNNPIVVEWSPVATAQTYDVVFGDLGQVRSSGGDFTASNPACLVHGTTATSAAFNATPSIGQGFWILVRGNNSSGTGTYDSGDPNQVGSRDAEIDASPFSCGGPCGDGACSGIETCGNCPADCGACPPGCGDGICDCGETCGNCPADCLTRYLDEDFSDNAAGWTLGNEWQIGPAQQSSCAEFGADDPAADHSVTGDNGVAGVVLGGCGATVLHPYFYLESPAFNTSTAPGVNLSFYRWLNSDAPPFMTSDIEVWNGEQWVAVWTQPSDGFPLFDAPAAGGPGWNFNQFDLSSYRNAAMRVRFGVKVEYPDAYVVGSWNIDDVRISSAPCP